MTDQVKEFLELLPDHLRGDENDLKPREKAFLEMLRRRDERMDQLHRMIIDE